MERIVDLLAGVVLLASVIAMLRHPARARTAITIGLVAIAGSSLVRLYDRPSQVALLSFLTAISCIAFVVIAWWIRRRRASPA